MKPRARSDSAIRSARMEVSSTSLTSSPAAIASFACRPTSVSAAIAARSACGSASAAHRETKSPPWPSNTAKQQNVVRHSLGHDRVLHLGAMPAHAGEDPGADRRVVALQHVAAATVLVAHAGFSNGLHAAQAVALAAADGTRRRLPFRRLHATRAHEQGRLPLAPVRRLHAAAAFEHRLHGSKRAKTMGVRLATFTLATTITAMRIFVAAVPLTELSIQGLPGPRDFCGIKCKGGEE